MLAYQQENPGRKGRRREDAFQLLPIVLTRKGKEHPLFFAPTVNLALLHCFDAALGPCPGLGSSAGLSTTILQRHAGTAGAPEPLPLACCEPAGAVRRPPKPRRLLFLLQPPALRCVPSPALCPSPRKADFRRQGKARASLKLGLRGREGTGTGCPCSEEPFVSTLHPFLGIALAPEGV